MAALNRRPAFLILLPTSSMAFRSPSNCVPTSLRDRDLGGAVAALDWRAVPARIGFCPATREPQIPKGNYSISYIN